MKNILLLISMLMLASCSARQEYVVRSDKNLEVDYSQYEDFSFASHARSDNAKRVFDDPDLKKQIRQSIRHELNAKGFDQTGESALLVNFRIFDKDLELTGFEGVYRDENYWSPTELTKEAIGLTPAAETRTGEDARTYDLKKGTLLIDMVDKNTGALIWRGYASGILQKNDDDIKNEVRTAVEMIFDKFDHRAQPVG